MKNSIFGKRQSNVIQACVTKAAYRVHNRAKYWQEEAYCNESMETAKCLQLQSPETFQPMLTFDAKVL